MYGLNYDAQRHAEESHMLPLPPNALGSNDFGKIYNDILDFIYNKDKQEFEPIYIPVQ